MKSSQLRQARKPVLIGFVGVAASIAVLILIVIVLAFVAQVIIAGN